MPFLKSFFKKNLLLLSLIFLVYSWFFATHIVPSKTAPPVISAKSEITLFKQPDAGRKPILDAIKNASQEILVEVYLLSDKEIIQALEDASEKGVNVYIMLEQHPFGGGNLNSFTESEIRSSGIHFKWTNPAFSLTHQKTIIIDKYKAFILDQNLTASSFSKNREYDILDLNPNDVLEIRNIFISDWERKSFISTSTHLIISPINSRSSITALINGSYKTIDIEAEEIEDNQIISILKEKAKTTNIRIILPSFSQISSNKDVALRLKESGISVKTLSSPYIHAKLMLIDDSKAYTGSVNLSAQSMDENRELGIILSEPNAMKTLISTFNDDWNKAADLSSN